MQAFSLYCVDRSVPERNLVLMPASMRSRICKCENRAGTKDRSIISVCSICNKPESYWMFRCFTCRELFIHDFRSWFCYYEPTCWNCISKDPTECNGHTYCETGIPVDKWVAPVLPIPKTYSKEELDSVFDF